MFSQKRLPDWFENHNVAIAKNDIHDYVLDLLEKVYKKYPELL